MTGQALGTVSVLIDCTVKYVLKHHAFGKPITKMQTIQMKISQVLLVDCWFS